MPKIKNPYISRNPIPSGDADVIMDPKDPDMLSGLMLFGIIIDRTRRSIKTRDEVTTEIVTYTVQDNCGRSYYVDEYSPKTYFNIGDSAIIPVYVKTYHKRNGEIGFSFNTRQQLEYTRGERF